MQEIRTAQTFAAFPVHYRIHLYVAASFATADKVTQDDIASRAPMFDMLKSRPDDQRHIIGAFELLCQVSYFRFFFLFVCPCCVRAASCCRPFSWCLLPARDVSI